MIRPIASGKSHHSTATARKSPEEALGVGRRVREHARYEGHTPLVVLAEKYGEESEGQDVNVGE